MFQQRQTLLHMSGLFVFMDFSLGYVCSFPYDTKPVVFVFLVAPKNVKLQRRQPSTHEQAVSCPQPKIGQETGSLVAGDGGDMSPVLDVEAGVMFWQ